MNNYIFVKSVIILYRSFEELFKLLGKPQKKVLLFMAGPLREGGGGEGAGTFG